MLAVDGLEAACWSLTRFLILKDISCVQTIAEANKTQMSGLTHVFTSMRANKDDLMPLLFSQTLQILVEVTQLALALATFKAIYSEFPSAHWHDVRVRYVSELTVCVCTRMFGFVVDVFRLET